MQYFNPKAPHGVRDDRDNHQPVGCLAAAPKCLERYRHGNDDAQQYRADPKGQGRAARDEFSGRKTPGGGSIGAVHDEGGNEKHIHKEQNPGDRFYGREIDAAGIIPRPINKASPSAIPAFMMTMGKRPVFQNGRLLQ